MAAHIVMETNEANITKEQQLVIGGGGYAGWHLVKKLVGKGFNVKVLDIQKPDDPLSSCVTFFEGDVTDFEFVKTACQDISCVYHLASFGMSGREQLNCKQIEKVNIHGTENVIKACLSQNVSRLVYTSTYNVVFGGKKIVNGDESLPYLPLNEHVDHYSRTKAVAEKKILSANGCPTCNGNILRTCALRLAGIYGPGEQRHLPRIVSYVKCGLFSFTYGSLDSVVDFLHVDNMVEAHISASLSLTASKHYIAAGEAYFISDGYPVNNFKFFKPLVEGLGYTYPKLHLPFGFVYLFAFLTELIHGIIGPIFNFQPILTRTEVYKTGITHYFNIAKAKSELRYNPKITNDIESVVRWYIDRGYHKSAEKCNHAYWMLILYVNFCIMLTVIIFASNF